MMKYSSQERVFKEKSLETKDAISEALANLRKNKLLDTCEFKVCTASKVGIEERPKASRPKPTENWQDIADKKNVFGPRWSQE